MANNKYGEKYTRELLAEAVVNSISIANVLAGQQKGEPSLSLPELSLANPDIRR